MTQPGRAAHGYAGQIELGIERGIVDGVLDLSKHVGWKMSFSAKLFCHQKAGAAFTGARAPFGGSECFKIIAASGGQDHVP